MTSPVGLWEHALYSTPRREHGYCADDNARALILLNREPDLSTALLEAYRIYMEFLKEAALPNGGFHNRQRADGSWADTIGSDDSQGRAIWAFGSTARSGPKPPIRDFAMELFRSQRFVSSSPRANAFAVLGAVDAHAAEQSDGLIDDALRNWVGHIQISDDPNWPWPETRLAYDNARIPEALIAAGGALDSDQLVHDGLHLLEWLVANETRDDRFSFTPVGGWQSGEVRPGFDQQPVEAAAVADACSRAWAATGDAKWRDHVLRAARWFLGDNDAESAMYDPETGGGYDGLTPRGPNLNQGAESTLAALSTFQQAGRLA